MYLDIGGIIHITQKTTLPRFLLDFVFKATFLLTGFIVTFTVLQRGNPVLAENTECNVGTAECLLVP